MEKKYRIGNLGVFILLAASGITDLLTFIPFVGDVAGPIYWIIAGIYFWRAGLGILNWRKAVPTIISFVAELVPVAQEFPTILAATAIIIGISRTEDKTGVSMMPNKGVKGKMNVGGRRSPTKEMVGGPSVVDGKRRPS